MFKRNGGVLAALALLAGLTGCGGAVYTPRPFDTAAQTASPASPVVAENGTFRMEWDDQTMSISVTDKRSGLRWGTTAGGAEEPEYDELGMPVKKHPQAESALFVEYLDAQSANTDTTISYNGSVRNGRVSCEALPDGLLVRYYFDETGFMIPVAYRLRETGVALSIDPTQIQEGENRITRISLAPFWCSVSNSQEDGYLLVPSGSGALIYPKQHSQAGLTYSAPVYGADAAMELWDDPVQVKSVRLPVYGAKDGGRATCAVIEQGAESAYIEVKAGAASLGYSAVYATFQLRGCTENVANLPNYQAVRSNVYAEGLICTPLQVGFTLLQDGEANYSGMAEVYRNYLAETQGLPSGGGEARLALDLIGGAMIQKSFLGIPYKTLYPATTLQQAADIVKDLQEAAGVSPAVNLRGFGETGLDTGRLAGGFLIHRSLGSETDLQALAEAVGDAPLFVDMDLVHLAKAGGGFSPTFDSARSASGKVAYRYGFHIAVRSRRTDLRAALLARSELAGAMDILLKRTASWPVRGIGLSSLSSTAYSDYTDGAGTAYYAKGGMAADVATALETLRGQGRTILVSDANAYAAVGADLILHAPTQSSREDLFDADIPFYAMVFRGHVPLACESVNLTPDPVRQVLQAVEGGCGLTYTLTAAYDGALLDAASPVFYNSRYEDLRGLILQNVKQLEDVYTRIGGASIKRHAILENGLRETLYDNGVSVYVNYSGEALESPIGRVPPQGFLAQEGAA